MPKEHRKRGKKKKPEPEWQPPVQEHQPVVEEPTTPAWIVSTQKNSVEEDVNPEAPFGYVDVDVKAYFRTVDVQIRDWQDTAAESGAGDEDTDPNEGAGILPPAMPWTNTNSKKDECSLSLLSQRWLGKKNSLLPTPIVHSFWNEWPIPWTILCVGFSLTV